MKNGIPTNEAMLQLARMVLQQATPATQENVCLNGFLKFTKGDLDKMPSKDKKYFKVEGHIVHYRERTDKNCKSIELNYRSDGYNIWASATTLDDAKARFIEKLHIIQAGGTTTTKLDQNFHKFAMYYFETFRKRKVAEETYKNDLKRYNKHIEPVFGYLPIKVITPEMCQNLLDKLTKEGKGKTADEIHSLLNIIFKNAIKHGILRNNPLDIVFHKKHDREHGIALTIEEEKLLLTNNKGTPFELMFAIALYTGLRPNEYATATITEDMRFIRAINSKRHNGKVEYKFIPITPMLAPYITEETVLLFSSVKYLRKIFHQSLPTHKLYDLRTTFYTRCQELGISPVARDEWVGHSNGTLANSYTDLSKEFLYKEGQKFKY